MEQWESPSLGHCRCSGNDGRKKKNYSLSANCTTASNAGYCTAQLVPGSKFLLVIITLEVYNEIGIIRKFITTLCLRIFHVSAYILNNIAYDVWYRF